MIDVESLPVASGKEISINVKIGDKNEPNLLPAKN
jgi:hypothetical protein